MESDARDDSAAGDAADSPRNDRRFVIPEARPLPDSEERSYGGEESQLETNVTTINESRRPS